MTPTPKIQTRATHKVALARATVIHENKFPYETLAGIKSAIALDLQSRARIHAMRIDLPCSTLLCPAVHYSALFCPALNCYAMLCSFMQCSPLAWIKRLYAPLPLVIHAVAVVVVVVVVVVVGYRAGYTGIHQHPLTRVFRGVPEVATSFSAPCLLTQTPRGSKLKQPPPHLRRTVPH